MNHSAHWFSSGKDQPFNPDYPIGHSLKFRGGYSSSYLQFYIGDSAAFFADYGKDPAAYNGCVSFWLKKGQQYSEWQNYIFNVSGGDWKAHTRLMFSCYNEGGSFAWKNRWNDEANDTYWTTAAQNDTHGWYHVFVRWQGSQDHWHQIWINGVKQSDAVQSRWNPYFSGTTEQYRNDFRIGMAEYENGFMNAKIADMYTTVTDDMPTRFGYFNEQGIWLPKDPELTLAEYGPAGFHLTFDPSQDVDPNVGVGRDSSGNGNHFTAFNFQLDNPYTWDYSSSTDSPTNNKISIEKNGPDWERTDHEHRQREHLDSDRFFITNYGPSYPGAGFPRNAPLDFQPVRGSGSKTFHQMVLQPGQVYNRNWYVHIGIAFTRKILGPDPNADYQSGFSFVWRPVASDASDDQTWAYNENGPNPTWETPVIEYPVVPGAPTIPSDQTTDTDKSVWLENNPMVWCGWFYDEGTGDIWFLMNRYNGEWWEPGQWDPCFLKPDGTYVPYNGTLPEDCKWNMPEANFYTYRFSRTSNSGGTRCVLPGVNVWKMKEGSLPGGFKHVEYWNDLPAPEITNPKDHFKTFYWSGDSTSGRQFDCGWKPGMVIVKYEGNSEWWHLADRMRGGGNIIYPNDWSAERNEPTTISAITETGFTLGNNAAVNQTGRNYYAYVWKGSDDLAAVNNTDGTNPTIVDANVEGGFSVVQYTGTGSQMTIGHGLSKPPEAIWVKQLNTARTWRVYANIIGPTGWLALDSSTSGTNYVTDAFAGVTPTDKVITIAAENGVNELDKPYIAYVWHSVPGLADIGGYYGNANNGGPHVHTGFLPALSINKNTAEGYGFYAYDNVKQTVNPRWPGTLDGVNGNMTGYENRNFVLNGMKLCQNGPGDNGAGQPIWHMTFADTNAGGGPNPPANAV